MIFDYTNLSPEVEAILKKKLTKEFINEKDTKISKAKTSQKKKNKK